MHSPFCSNFVPNRYDLIFSPLILKGKFFTPFEIMIGKSQTGFDLLNSPQIWLKFSQSSVTEGSRCGLLK